MTFMRGMRMKRRVGAALLIVAVWNSGCATDGRSIFLGAGLGAGVGALVGTQIGDPEDQIRNSIITGLIVAAISAGALAWHYREMEQLRVDISGRYSRYRLCNTEELGQPWSPLGKEENGVLVYRLAEDQIGKLSLALDESTKWVYPTFRKRYLMPEVGSSQMLSKRFVWEIIKEGFFVTSLQNPEYFLKDEEKGNETPAPAEGK